MLSQYSVIVEKQMIKFSLSVSMSNYAANVQYKLSERRGKEEREKRFSSFVFQYNGLMPIDPFSYSLKEIIKYFFFRSCARRVVLERCTSVARTEGN